jgi:hypothetical protein
LIDLFDQQRQVALTGEVEADAHLWVQLLFGCESHLLAAEDLDILVKLHWRDAVEDIVWV